MNFKNTLLALAAASVFGITANQINVQRVVADGVPYVTAGQSGLPAMDVVDIASYQGNLSVDDFNKMKAAGIKGVIVKLTESTDYTNPYARTQVDNARAAGMKVSAYHFARFHDENGARAEADYFANVAYSLGFSSSDLMVDDVEDNTLIKDNVSNNARVFNDQLHARGFSDTALYTYSTYNMDRSFMSNDHIWMASYPYEPSSDHLWNTQYGMWQWTSNAHVNGVSGTFDMSVDYTGLASRDSGYRYVPEAGGWRWVEDGKMFTGFKYYMGTYYWFENGVRSDKAWHEAWGHMYYTGADGRAVQGVQNINGQNFDFGSDGTFYMRSSGYLYDGSSQNGGYRWYENGQLYTGFRYYMGTYYWFVDGVRQNAGWREAWGMKYYTDDNGRAVQGTQKIDGTYYYFGDDGTYYERGGYLFDGSSQNGGYRWYENGQLFTGFRYYMGTYYWFVDGVRQNAGWREAWGMKYYTDQDGRAVQGIQTINGQTYNFGNDGTYYLR
ncbi:GH25 family lysozyme [Fructobacillus papyrifericola]|uniref:Lysozyme n=1 Tax=Fructobacillus papyrifericola TaxID=2713172 RepID=A0ABS5QSH0_9LACO|nr:GH25 family lysozyme [Fructobacillus papyrifericola]MBS9335777.1 1,4-beta-N-acetylmuramidase [Fructobacillus papyrifericola]